VVQESSGEECDDGNNINTDGCRNTCVLPECGDNILDPGENCDGTLFEAGSACETCRPDCTCCGDGNTDAGEECDDGNNINTDGCRNTCVLPECGDDILDPGENCDGDLFEAGSACETCRPDCTCCGDGNTDSGEECDDGNNNNADGCRNNCMLPECGDGILDPNESCDGTQFGDTACESCRPDCTCCGDGSTDSGEECDDGNNNNADGCRNNCTEPECGDGILDPGESCDGTLFEAGSACETCRGDCTCCGDGSTDSGEECDDGNNNNNDDCRNNCTEPECGDGIVDAGEECDAGAGNSNAPCAACRPDCTLPECGDDIADDTGCSDETCDGPDLGDTACETCRANCTCCGDGVVDTGEECDDGNNVDTDECLNDCTEPVGGEGCTPGYWKQDHHFCNWPPPYTPSTKFLDVFTQCGGQYPANQTLVGALSTGGGGFKAMGRHAVAALLNAASPQVESDLEVNEVIDLVNDACTGAQSVSTVHGILAGFNEQDCPLGNCKGRHE
jgi:cysteine-rich repeat protein